jgi:hypothetical protein
MNRIETSDELTVEDKGLVRELPKKAAEIENEARNSDE